MNLPRLREEFARNFEEREELGASVSIWNEGKELITLAGGFQDREKTVPWRSETLVLFWSATKGPAAGCVLQAAERFGVPLETPIAAVWPEFGSAGKEQITIEDLLSHRAGLPALAKPISPLEHEAVVETLATQAPEWWRGEGHGYHPRTYGYLVDEVVRRISGQTMQQYWREHFAEPLQLDLWMGVPAELVDSVAPIFPPRRSPAKGDPFFTAYLTAGSLTARSFASPRGLHSASQMNAPEVRMASLPAFGGIGTARALAKFYAVLAEGGALEGRRYLTEATVRRLRETLTQGPDKVLISETAFTLGFMKDPVDAHGRKERAVFGPSFSAFGQPGAGGSTAFADPENRLSFAYVMNQMDAGVLPNPKSLSLIEALYA